MRGHGRRFEKGKKLPMKEVLCTKGCKTMLLRFNHLSDAICRPCQRKQETRQHVALIAEQRLFWRRLKTLLAVSGYSYDALLESVRFRRIAETRRSA